MRMKQLCHSGIIIALIAMVPNIVQAKEILLGRTILLSHVAEQNAQIPVRPCRYANSLQIEARKDLFLSQVIVKFKNGESQTLGFHRLLREGQKTMFRPFSISHRLRCVKHIEVKGRPHHGTAGVRVYGRRPE